MDGSLLGEGATISLLGDQQVRHTGDFQEFKFTKLEAPAITVGRGVRVVGHAPRPERYMCGGTAQMLALLLLRLR